MTTQLYAVYQIVPDAEGELDLVRVTEPTPSMERAMSECRELRAQDSFGAYTVHGASR